MAKSKKKFSINDAKKLAIWVAIPVALLIAFGVKMIAVGQIEKNFETTKSELENAKSDVQKIVSDSKQPNQKNDRRNKPAHGDPLLRCRNLLGIP